MKAYIFFSASANNRQLKHFANLSYCIHRFQNENNWTQFRPSAFALNNATSAASKVPDKFNAEASVATPALRVKCKFESPTVLPLPAVRCLSKEQAAEYLGIGVTLLTELGVPFTKLGRRCVYDRVDLDEWLNEYKQRGRAGKETIWPVKPESTGGRTLDTGGLVVRSQTAKEYAKVLGLKTGMKQKPC